MLFEILTEDVSDGFIENDVLRVLASTSDIVQETLGLKKGEDGQIIEPTIEQIRSTGGSILHWTEAESVANADDVDKLIFAFTSVLAVSDRIEPVIATTLRTMDIWLHIMSELGFRSQENPFISYVSKYKNFDIELIRAQLIVLNNLFSDRTINKNDLNDASSILYNKEIWLLGMDDGTKLLENYYYVKGHRSSYNKEVVPTKNIERTIKARVDEHPDSMENYIVFKNYSSSPSVSTGLEPAYVVAEFVDKFFVKSKSTNNKSEEETDTVSRSNLPREKKDALNKAIKDSGLKFSDLADITVYFNELKGNGLIG